MSFKKHCAVLGHLGHKTLTKNLFFKKGKALMPGTVLGGLDIKDMLREFTVKRHSHINPKIYTYVKYIKPKKHVVP